MTLSEFWHGPFRGRLLGCKVVFFICLKTVSGIPVTSAPVSFLNVMTVPLTVRGTVQGLTLIGGCFVSTAPKKLSVLSCILSEY